MANYSSQPCALYCSRQAITQALFTRICSGPCQDAATDAGSARSSPRRVQCPAARGRGDVLDGALARSDVAYRQGDLGTGRGRLTGRSRRSGKST